MKTKEYNNFIQQLIQTKIEEHLSVGGLGTIGWQDTGARPMWERNILAQRRAETWKECSAKRAAKDGRPMDPGKTE